LPFIVLYSYPYISIVRKVTHNYLSSDIEGNINTWQWWCEKGKCYVSEGNTNCRFA